MTQTYEEMFAKFGKMLDTNEKRRDTEFFRRLSSLTSGVTPVTRKAAPAPAPVRGRRKAAPAAAPVPTAKVTGKGRGRKAEPTAAAETPKRRGRSGGADRFVDRIYNVMGAGDIVSADDVIAGLTKAKQMPNSENPRNYILFMLSQNKNVFKQVSRGRYQRIEGALGKAEGVTSEATGVTSTESGDPTSKDLADLGIQPDGSATNPFP